MQHHVGIRDLVRLDDAAARLGRRDQKAVVGADEQAAVRRPERDGVAARPDARVDDRKMHPDGQVRDRAGEHAGAVPDRLRPDPVGDVDDLRLRAGAQDDTVADADEVVRGAEVRQERDDCRAHGFDARRARIPGGSPCTSSHPVKCKPGRGHVVQEVGQREVPGAGQPAHAVAEPRGIEMQPLDPSSPEERARRRRSDARTARRSKDASRVDEPPTAGEHARALAEGRRRLVDVGVGEGRDDRVEPPSAKGSAAASAWTSASARPPARSSATRSWSPDRSAPVTVHPASTSSTRSRPPPQPTSRHRPGPRPSRRSTAAMASAVKLATAGRSDHVSYQSARPS